MVQLKEIFSIFVLEKYHCLKFILKHIALVAARACNCYVKHNVVFNATKKFNISKAP